LWVRRPRLPHTHTQPRGTIVSKRFATPLTPAVGQGPDIATVWQCPTPAYTRTARRCTNNTQSHGHRAVCPSATIMSTKYRDRTTTGRNATTAAPTHWGTPPFGDDTPGRRRPQRKGKGRCMNKGFCAKTDLCPLASPRVALVGLRATTRVPLAKPPTQHWRWPSEHKGTTVGWEGLYNRVSPGCRHAVQTLIPQRHTTATPQIPKGCSRNVISLSDALPGRLR